MAVRLGALTGYKGKNCELDVDDCASSPCNAEGTERCEDGINSFTCHCLDLWQGRWLASSVDNSSPFKTRVAGTISITSF